jgi:cytoskeletal protein CcmA (bactofilin family)
LGFFSRKPTEPPPPKTRVAPGTHLQGDLESKEDLTLDGNLEGNLLCHGEAVLGKAARLSGQLRSESLRCDGAGSGLVQVSGTARFGSTSSWEGEFKVGTLRVDPGARLSGKFVPPAASEGRKGPKEK